MNVEGLRMREALTARLDMEHAIELAAERYNERRREIGVSDVKRLFFVVEAEKESDGLSLYRVVEISEESA